MILIKKIFEKIYVCKFVTLVEKLINTVDKKEENQIIIDDIENNRYKISKEYKFDKDVIKHSGDLYDAVKIILEINKVLTSNKVNNDNNLIKLYKKYFNTLERILTAKISEKKILYKVFGGIFTAKIAV